MTNRSLINPALPLKPVWQDDAYINKGKAEIYLPHWVSIPTDKIDAYAARCDKTSANEKGALFGYKGTYFKEGKDLPRNVLCVAADRSEAWADMASFKEPA